MTLFDQQTDLLPPVQPVDGSEPPRVRTGMLVAGLVGILVVLLATVGVVAETVIRAESTRAVAEEVRSRFALPDSERVEADIAGPVLIQGLLGRFDRVGVTIYSYPTGRANADLTVTLEGVHRADGEWMADHVSGAAILSAAQATALFLPPELQGTARVGFSGGDIVVGVSALGGTTPQSVSVSMKPRFDNGRLSASVSSMRIGDKTLSADEMATQAGADVAALQSDPVCLSEGMPRALRLRDVRVVDERLRMEFDVDVPASVTPAGREPGSCP